MANNLFSLLLTIAIAPIASTAIDASPALAQTTNARANAIKATPTALSQLNVTRPVPRRTAPSQTRRSRRGQSRLPAPPRRLPPNRVQPGGGLSAAASSCGAQRPLTALVPVENPVFTASAAPSFWFYFPDSPESIDYAEFVLLTADEKEQVYAARFLPGAPGIASVSLPAEADQQLEVGGAYHWYLNVHCKSSPTVLTVDGWAQRLASAEGVESAEGSELPPVWYDAIAEAGAAVAYSGSQSQAQQRWEQWLTAAGLADLVGMPVLGEVSQ